MAKQIHSMQRSWQLVRWTWSWWLVWPYPKSFCFLDWLVVARPLSNAEVNVQQCSTLSNRRSILFWTVVQPGVYSLILLGKIFCHIWMPKAVVLELLCRWRFSGVRVSVKHALVPCITWRPFLDVYTLNVGVQWTMYKLCERRLFFYAELRKKHVSAIVFILRVPPLPFRTRRCTGKAKFRFKDFTAILRPPKHWETLFMYRRQCCSQTPLTLCDPTSVGVKTL